jgi:hypothetical protein
MDEEDIVSLEENESIFKNMKKKDSKTTYLRTKGAFLSAIAIHESESELNNSETLLSNEDLEVEKSEEISTMNDITKDDDILAVATGLSEDLSNIASSQVSEEVSEEVSAEENQQPEEQDESVEATEEAEETIEASDASEEAAEDVAEEAAAEEISTDDSEQADVQEETVDSEEAEKPEESSDEVSDEVQEESQEESLTAEESSDEQASEDQSGVIALLEEKVQSLQAENAKLKGALHMTLVERVVDTKIALGLAEGEQREDLISEHASRTASSLADSLRDMAVMPAKVGKRTALDSIEFEVETAQVTEDVNVASIDLEVEEEASDPEVSFEQVLVDTLMGRRKL